MAALWAGIDEAGYGPNLGPFVMTLVVAEGERPDLWADRPATIGRAGSNPSLLWVDDSKKIYHSGDGLDRLNAATLATLTACGHPAPSCFSELLATVAAGTFEDVELSPWLGVDANVPAVWARAADLSDERPDPIPSPQQGEGVIAKLSPHSGDGGILIPSPQRGEGRVRGETEDETTEALRHPGLRLPPHPNPLPQGGEGENPSQRLPGVAGTTCCPGRAATRGSDSQSTSIPPAHPFHGERWRLVAVRSVVVGPARFNRDLDRTGSKARVHFEAFARLLTWLWDQTDGETGATSDKHGGRHFYLEPLLDAFPGLWIDRGEEGPELSRYTLRDARRRLSIQFRPRADASDGLVALASLVSKTLREHWMATFNAHWQARIPDLRPTAGYPVDAARFRAAIEPLCRERGLEPDQWWRKK